MNEDPPEHAPESAEDAALDADLEPRADAVSGVAGDFEQTAEAGRPRLWNPNAAANWSVLFSPLFGALLHARNWRALGKPEKAKQNIVWAWCSAIYTVVVLVSFLFPSTPETDRFFQLVALGMLVSWYLSQGKPQAKYVKEHFAEGYDKKRWGKPLGIGLLCLFVYVVVCFVIIFSGPAYTPQELAEEIQPIVEKQLRKDPQMRDAKVEITDLEYKGDDLYIGKLFIRQGNETDRMIIEITASWSQMGWELKPYQVAY